MAPIKNPILFSEHFQIDKSYLKDAGLIDPFLNVDTPLFIDPVLLEKSSIKVISKNAYASFKHHFSTFIRLLKLSKNEGDAAWKTARKLLDLSEPPDNGLGYGGSGRRGASRPEEIREAIMRTCKEIISLGADDPDMISLMGFFEEQVGPDTISDFTTQVIRNELALLTQEFCKKYGIPLQEPANKESPALPIYSSPDGKSTPIVLVPEDIVRDLPIARDWSEIESAALANTKIRERVNQLLGRITGSTVKERKEALRQIATESKESFEYFLGSVKEHASFYDPWLDSLAYYKVKSILADGFPSIPRNSYDLKQGPEEIARLVDDTLNAFAHHVEKGNLWEELWIEGKPKKERAAQLIYYAIADCYCKANDVDISPEAQMGGGPVDFKFSDGYRARVVVEMKRSSGTVVHGYEKQLEIYKNASKTNHGIFVIIDYGGLGGKLRKIEKIRNRRIQEGLPASEIRVIDAKRKDSASKRK